MNIDLILISQLITVGFVAAYIAVKELITYSFEYKNIYSHIIIDKPINIKINKFKKSIKLKNIQGELIHIKIDTGNLVFNIKPTFMFWDLSYLFRGEIRNGHLQISQAFLLKNLILVSLLIILFWGSLLVLLKPHSIALSMYFFQIWGLLWYCFLFAIKIRTIKRSVEKYLTEIENLIGL